MNRSSSSALKIAGLFLLGGTIWLAASEVLLRLLSDGSAWAATWRTASAGLFVAAGAIWLVLSASRRPPEHARVGDRDPATGSSPIADRTPWAAESAVAAVAVDEQLFRVIFEKAPIGIAQVSPEGRMLRINPHFCALVGRTERDLQRMTFADFTHPDDLQADLHLVSRCLSGEIDRYSMEKRYHRPDGQVVWVNLYVTLVRDQRGQPAYFVSVVTDITWRKAAEAALAESRQRLQSAVEIARLGFWEYDTGTKSLFYSREAKAQLGYEDEDVSNSPEEYRRRVHPADAARLAVMRETVLAGKQDTAEGEFRFLHQDGTYRDLFVRTVLLRDARGRPARLLGTNFDLTPTRDSERLVRQLSARILRLQDSERRRIARQLHDTTAQNLAALNMNLARLGRVLGPAGIGGLDTLQECVALTDMCVQEIRTLAYLLHPPLLDEFGLERAVQDYVQGFAKRSGVETTVTVDGQIGRLSDEVELSLFRVLQESLTNVVRHAACQRASVQLSRREGIVRLEIRDAGRGIAPETLQRLRAGSPLGVGVTGMSERLEQIGGRLEIESGPEGTTVSATVPTE